MATRKPHHPHLAALPGKHWFYRSTVLLMVTVGIALMVMSKAGNPAVTKLRTSITDAVVPVLTVAASPINALRDAGAWIADTAHIRQDNILLKNQNAQLLQWQKEAKDLAEENRALRELMHVIPPQRHNYITARVVSDLGGPYAHSALITGGSAQGIKKDLAVMNERGLAGRVVDVGAASARILLLTDINSRVPVVIERIREKAIVAGGNGAFLTLTYLIAGSAVQEGDRLLTSGDGGIFPPGIPVGVVTTIDKGAVTVQPYVDPVMIDYVSIVDYAE